MGHPLLRVLRADIVLGLCVAAVAWWAALALLSASLSFLGLGTTALHLPAALLASAGACAAYARGRFPSRRAAGAGIFVLFCALLAACCWVGSRAHDLSSDGQSYHQEGIASMAEGWAPFRRELPGARLRLKWYPKCPWFCAAAIYKSFGSLEAAKGLNLLLMLASFAAAWLALRELMPRRPAAALALAAAAALNPVAVHQAFSFYVDGQVASFHLLLLSSGALYYLRADPWALGVFAACLMLLIGTKMTGVPFAALYCLGLWGSLRRDRPRQASTRVAGALGAALAAGIFWTGFSPYVRNVLNGHSPFAPFWGTGRNAEEFMGSGRPASFAAMNRFERLGAALFSRTANFQAEYRLKIPFSIEAGELAALTYDTRLGGFGPLHGGLLLAGLGLLAAAWAARAPGAGQAARAAAWVALSAVMHRETWWARLSPQLWLLPAVCLLPGLRAHGKILRGASAWALAAMAANAALCGWAYFPRLLRRDALLREQIEIIKRSEEPVYVRFGKFSSNRFRLRDAGVRYRLFKDPPCREWFTLASSDTEFCLP